MTVDPESAEDAARLYDQGWPIERVARLFEYSEDEIRKLLTEGNRHMNGNCPGVSWI